MYPTYPYLPNTQLAEMRQQGQQPAKTQKVGRNPGVPERYGTALHALHMGPCFAPHNRSVLDHEINVVYNMQSIGKTHLLLVDGVYKPSPSGVQK